MLSRTKFIGAVEIGTSKITVIVGQVARGRSLSLIGLGECPSRGVSKGTVVDFKAATECVHAALEEAERSAGARVGEVSRAERRASGGLSKRGGGARLFGRQYGERAGH